MGFVRQRRSTGTSRRSAVSRSRPHTGRMASASRAARLALVGLFLLVRPAAAPASAELVLLTTGRTLAISGHAFEGDRVVLYLPNGGEIVCDRSLIVRIEPDPAPPPAVPMVAEAPPSRPFAEIIDAASVRHGVPPALVYALIEVESAYQPWARSSKGAMGLMQLMPATARQYAVADPFDPMANVEAGTRHLRSLLDRYENNIDSALAAYNAGEGPVRKYDGVPPYPETIRYVTKILELVAAAQNE